MTPSLRQIQAFLLVYRHRSISAAAVEMGVTQSAVSLALKELEVAFGVRLFDRTTRAITPTSATEYALPIVQRIVADIRSLEHSMGQLAEAKSGRIVFAASPAIASALMPNVVAKFRREAPLIQVEMQDVSPERLLEGVLAAEFEFGIGNVEHAHPDLMAKVLMKGQVVAAVHKRQPLATRKEVSWRELASLPVIAMRKGTDMRAQMDKTLAKYKTSLLPVHDVSLFSTSLAFTSEDLGVSILPIHLISSQGSSLVTLPLVNPTIYREVTFIHRSNISPSPAVALFLTIMKRCFAEMFSKHKQVMLVD
jgi:DNA-binding transcriptional LysR family regulator